MRVSALQPQFILQSSQTGNAAQERQRSRGSRRDQQTNHKSGRDSKHSEGDGSKDGKQTAHPANSGVEENSRSNDSELYTGIQRSEPLRMHSITTADLAAALAPERLFQSDQGSAVSNQTHLKDSSGRSGKNGEALDPIAAVLRRLAFQTAEESSKKLQALSAYAKVRDALKPPPLPSLKMLSEQNALNAGAFFKTAGATVPKGTSEVNKLSLSQLNSSLSNPELEIFEQLNAEDQALIALKAFQHIDLAA